MIPRFPDTIFQLKKDDFSAHALEIFRFQYFNNPIYQQYTDSLGIDPQSLTSIQEIPFLPVNFFKTHPVMTTSFEPEIIFESSGTTQSVNSRHLVRSLALYEKSFTMGFESFYGPVSDYCVLGLLPSYLERTNSSLVNMVNNLIRKTAHSQSGFYLYDHNQLFSVLQELEEQQQKTLLIGVTYALLDFSENYSMDLVHTQIMETGGMKGRRKEMTRQEVHGILKERFGLQDIQSEYGMTELLSQAYSRDHGVFRPPPWLKVLVRAEDDPLEVRQQGPGLINVIDLANYYSCSFIATEDIGEVMEDGSFEIWGRMDNSDLRGCNLMVGGQSL